MQQNKFINAYHKKIAISLTPLILSIMKYFMCIKQQQLKGETDKWQKVGIKGRK